MLRNYEVPVAYAMTELATQLRQRGPHPLEMFTLYWVAFNSIYATLAEQAGVSAKWRHNKKDGSPKFRVVSRMQMPDVGLATDQEQMARAFERFGASLRRRLVEHPSTRFFVDRTPKWGGQTIPTDARGQRLNGVMKVAHTLDAAHPVWAPIDASLFEEYQAGARDEKRRDALAWEIVELLYAVRNNTFHGSKNPHDGSDREVLEMAVPLIQLVVESLMYDDEGR